MEEKCIRTRVTYNETVHCETAECPIDIDFTLPDFCPDISKVFKCRAVVRVASKSVSGKSVTVDGSAAVTVLYGEENGKLCSYEYQYPFSKTIETPEEISGTDVRVCAECEYINCRAVTARKMDIHGAALLKVTVLRRKNAEIVSDIDDDNIEQLHGTVSATVPMGYCEKYLMVEEELPVGQGQPAIASILRYDAKPYVEESKIINDKIVAKGTITLGILYRAEETMALQSLKTNIPFSQIMDMEGANDSCKCDVTARLCFLEVKAKQGENSPRFFTFTAKLLLEATAYCDNEVAVLMDAFSRKYEADIKTDPIRFDRIEYPVREVFHCKKNLELESAVNSVNEFWCDMQSSTCRFEENQMVISGILVACMVTTDEDSNAAYAERNVEFEYRYQIGEGKENLSCDPVIDILSSGYTLIGTNGIELRVDLGIYAPVYASEKLNLITEISVNEKCPKTMDERSAMTVYFTGTGENVWDIAKRYNAGISDIMEINDLESEELPEGKMLLVPSV